MIADDFKSISVSLKKMKNSDDVCEQCEDAGWVLSSYQAVGAPNFMECPECENPMERRAP